MLLAGAPLAQAEAGGAGALHPYVQAQAEGWSNGLPVLDLAGDWGGSAYTPRGSDQHAYVSARAELGVWSRLNGRTWGLAWLARADGTARASGQAAQVLYHYQSRTDPDQPATYNADTDTLFWRGRGVSLHLPLVQAGPDAQWALDATWDHMRLQRLRSLHSRGQVAYNADQSYSYSGTLRDDDVAATTPFMAQAERSGVGDALSLKLDWRQPAEAPPGGLMPRHARIRVEDLWSRLRWDGINGNNAVLDSNVSQRTPEGYIEYRAAINGQYTRRRVSERIPTAVQLEAAWAAPVGEWTVRLRQRMGLRQHWLGWQGEGENRWRLAVEPIAGAWQVGGDYGALNITLMGSRLDRSAHQRALQLGWDAPF